MGASRYATIADISYDLTSGHSCTNLNLARPALHVCIEASHRSTVNAVLDDDLYSETTGVIAGLHNDTIGHCLNRGAIPGSEILTEVIG